MRVQHVKALRSALPDDADAVDHRIGAHDMRQPVICGEHLPEIDARAAGWCDYLMAGSKQRSTEVAADEPGCAGEQDSHDVSPVRSGTLTNWPIRLPTEWRPAQQSAQCSNQCKTKRIHRVAEVGEEIDRQHHQQRRKHQHDLRVVEPEGSRLFVRTDAYQNVHQGPGQGIKHDDAGCDAEQRLGKKQDIGVHGNLLIGLLEYPVWSSANLTSISIETEQFSVPE